MKNTLYIFTIALLFFTAINHAQQTPAPTQNKIISIVGVTAHIGNGNLIENATIIFEDGLISEIGNSDSVSAKGEIIDAKGKHVYPGFILPNSSLGLGEIDAVKATRDDNELGSLIPHVRSLIAYNAESKVTESVRPNGVLIAQITPRGGRISGTSSIVQLDAWNWEDAAIKVDDGIHANWPNSYNRKFLNRQIISEPNKDYKKQIDELKDFLIQAQTYSLSTPIKKNLPFDATKGIFSGEQKLYIHVKREKEIIDAVNFAIDLDIPKVVLVGADEAYKVTDLLKKYNIPVLLKRVHTLPSSEDDDYDLPFKMASILFKKGVLTALEGSGQMERMNSRNLPFYAGTTTGYGLNDEEALELITLNPAKILGIDDKYGSLEVGKSATLFISEGNALDMRTNIISKAFIDGRDISLETHQTKLYKRYMDKYGTN